MKQKLLNSTLYVFDVDPYIITEDASEATVIKVQEESYKGFVTMNPDLVDKLTKYNYHVICVNTPEWAPYVDEEDPQEPLTFGIYGATAADVINQIQVQNENNEVLYHWDAPDIQFPFQCNVEEGQHCVIECKEGIFDIGAQFDVAGIEYLPVRWVNEETGRTWYATQPITESISIGIDAASPSTYKLYLSGRDINDSNLRVDIDHNTISLVTLVDGIDIAQDTLIEVWLLTEDINDYDVSLISTWMNQSTEGGLHYWRNMPAEDKTIDIPFIGGGVNFNASWSRNQNVSQINIGNTSVTGSDLTDSTWHETVRLYPGTSQVQYFVSTGLPTDMQKFEIMLQYQAGVDETNEEHHYAYKQTDPDTGEVFYSDAQDASGTGITNHGTWTYNNTPDTGLPWIAFTLPSTDANGNAFVDNTEIIIGSDVSGS